MRLRKVPPALFAAIAALSSALFTASAAQADSEFRGSASRYRFESSDPVPDTDLIASGLFTFGVPYIASVAIATQSTRRGDDYLYTPVAGPWLDLARREECATPASCNNETAYRLLLVADGVLQGFGALEVLGGFLFPTSRPPAAAPAAARVHVSPAVGRGGYGVSAFGTF